MLGIIVRVRERAERVRKKELATIFGNIIYGELNTFRFVFRELVSRQRPDARYFWIRCSPGWCWFVPLVWLQIPTHISYDDISVNIFL